MSIAPLVPPVPSSLLVNLRAQLRELLDDGQYERASALADYMLAMVGK